MKKGVSLVRNARAIALILIVVTTFTLGVQAQNREKPTGSYPEIFTTVQKLGYNLVHGIGKAITGIVSTTLPSIPIPKSLVDWIEGLTLATIMLGLTRLMKKLIWGLVIAGWLLVVVQIGRMILQAQK